METIKGGRRVQTTSYLVGKAKQLRKDIVYMTTKAGIGHVTSSFSCVDILTTLYYGGYMKYKADDPSWDGRDYFIFSKGHANPALYCILADLGYFPKADLDLFCQPGGKIGVLLKGDIPGAEITAGSLGCGLGIAAGIATALKFDSKTNKVFCMVGDAECREGAIWEAAMYIGYMKLTNLVTIIDKNQLGATHFVEEEAGIEPLNLKFEAFGFEVRIINGHNIEEVMSSLDKLEKLTKPLVIIANTIKGKGVSFIENKPLMHGEAIKQQDLERAIDEIERGLVI